MEVVSATGDTIPVSHANGSSDGSVIVTVADPLAVTGDAYEIQFHSSATWGVYNSTKGVWAIRDLNNQSGDKSYPIVDGFMPIVKSPPNDFKAFETVSNANGPIDPSEIAVLSVNNNGFPILVNSLYPNGTSRPHGTRQQSGSAGLTDTCGWIIHTGSTTTPKADSYSYFTTRVSWDGVRWPHIMPYDFEIRFTYQPDNWALAPDAYNGSPNVMMNVPFEIWNIGANTVDDQVDDYRLFPYIIDKNANGTFDLSANDHSASDGSNDPETDWIYWVIPLDKTPGESGYQSIVSNIQADVAGHLFLDPTVIEDEGLRRVVLVAWNMGDTRSPLYPANLLQTMPEAGTIFRITTKRQNTTADWFAFDTRAFAARTGKNAALKSAQNIRAFPNPFYAGENSLSAESRPYVTFTNLPAKATIRIYNLAGHLVRTLNKDTPSQFHQWDLTNEHRWAVASGFYICYIELPEIGATKIIKLAVVQALRSPY